MEQRAVLQGILSLAVSLLLTGCAHMWVDAQGNRHIVGIVSIQLPPPDVKTGAESIRTQSVGFSLTRTPIGSSIVLGYEDFTLTAIQDNSFVLMPKTTSLPATDKDESCKNDSIF